MRNPLKRRTEQQVIARRQVRQEQAAAYDPDVGDINFNLRRADQLRNTPAARKARAALKNK